MTLTERAAEQTGIEAPPWRLYEVAIVVRVQVEGRGLYDARERAEGYVRGDLGDAPAFGLEVIGVQPVDVGGEAYDVDVGDVQGPHEAAE